MDDIDMLFLYKHYLDGCDLSFLEGADKRKRQEGDKMLVEICNRIANATTQEEYKYWQCRRDQFFEEGEAAVRATIEDDIAEGFYPEETGEWQNDN